MQHQMRKWPKKSLLLRKENDTHQAPQLVSLQNKINHHKWDVWISALLQPPTCAGGCTSANPSNAKPSKGNGAGPASVRGWERSLPGQGMRPTALVSAYGVCREPPACSPYHYCQPHPNPRYHFQSSCVLAVLNSLTLSFPHTLSCS